MKKHEIKLTDLLDYLNKEEHLYARDSNGNKSLYITLRGNFVVKSGEMTIYNGSIPVEAVDTYNNV